MFNVSRTEKGQLDADLFTVPKESLLGGEIREYLDFLIFPLPKSSLFGRSFARFDALIRILTTKLAEISNKLAPKGNRLRPAVEPVLCDDA